MLFLIYRIEPPPQEATMISRTNLKQQMMREQMLQQEQKERKMSTSAPSQTSTAIRVPLYASPAPVTVPKQVLMVSACHLCPLDPASKYQS